MKNNIYRREKFCVMISNKILHVWINEKLQSEKMHHNFFPNKVGTLLQIKSKIENNSNMKHPLFTVFFFLYYVSDKMWEVMFHVLYYFSDFYIKILKFNLHSYLKIHIYSHIRFDLKKY